MHRALCVHQTLEDLDKAEEMKSVDYLEVFADKWQLNKKTLKTLESNNVIQEEDFLDLSEADIENLGLTIGQKNSLKRGIAILRMTAATSVVFGDVAINSEKMGFIKSAFYLFLRYIFLGIIIAYNTVARMWQTMLTPFEPVRSAAQKVPEEEISLGGIFATLKRLAFIGLLVWATMVQSVLDRLLQPVYNVVENMSDFVERHSPENTSRLTKVE